MTLRLFAGLGALLSSISGLALISSVDIRVGEPLIALSCLSVSGAVLYRVMGKLMFKHRVAWFSSDVITSVLTTCKAVRSAS